MPALALALIPLIPGAISGIISIVDAIRNHNQTPVDVAKQLDAISQSLKDIVAQVEAVELPNG